MADPFTLAMIGATAGALTNEDDPLKGALIGGLGGYAGGSALGLGATQAAAPISNAMLAEGAATVPGLTATSTAIPVADVGFIPSVAGAAPAAGMGFGEYMALNTASGLLSPQRPQGGAMAMAPAGPRQPYQPTMDTQGLLATPDMRRRQFAFA